MNVYPPMQIDLWLWTTDNNLTTAGTVHVAWQSNKCLTTTQYRTALNTRKYIVKEGTKHDIIPSSSTTTTAAAADTATTITTTFVLAKDTVHLHISCP